MVWGTAVWAVRDGPAGPRVREKYIVLTSLGLDNSQLTFIPRLYATIVVFYTNGTRSLPSGRKTYIAMISPLADRWPLLYSVIEIHPPALMVELVSFPPFDEYRSGFFFPKQQP